MDLGIISFQSRCPICYHAVTVPYDVERTEEGTILFHLLGTYPVHEECKHLFKALQATKGGYNVRDIS